MKTLIAAVVSFFNPSVDSVLSSFTKTVSRLEKVAARASTRAAAAQDEIDRALAARRAAYLEQDRATAVAAKLNDLFGVK